LLYEYLLLRNTVDSSGYWPHRWCNDSHLECGWSCVRTSYGSNQWLLVFVVTPLLLRL